MSGPTVNTVDTSQPDDMAPPPGTAIVRPLRHVRAVRECHAQQVAGPAGSSPSRSSRAWAWALGESAIAPVSDRPTPAPPAPPARADIEAEIAEAGERQVRQDQDGRADGAAIILRWLIGADDHVPVRCTNPGELAGGFGDVVRSREQIAETAALAARAHRVAGLRSQSASTSPSERATARGETGYLDGVLAALAWAGGERATAPVTGGPPCDGAARTLKRERLHAEDAIERGADPWEVGFRPSRWYGHGVKAILDWLLGDQTAAPMGP
jgi:hypothetical protein